ncbi:family 20 glycosylhydrolase [Massilia sp. Dwa41.01b]|uniref:family 20 glycosylhydrolase n=1 Tax=Massilia sp. Dwa41.01b TaxID=2709302 RepID=UPI0035A6FB57
MLGLQGQLWGENAHSRARIEYLVAPRLLALAERAWSLDPGWLAADCGSGPARRADRGRLERIRQPPRPARTAAPGPRSARLRLSAAATGVVRRDGVIQANVALPGLSLRYAFDNGELDGASPRYTGPLTPPPGAGTLRIASFDTRGRASRVVTLDLKDAPDA